ncbi:NADH-quinone oxidoreductase subunit L [Fodinicola acaciae]|uniref:NADH-quinone oxidoreductase subunit L n=1 Tax=Fodinicola acaciae TaxID=2681555 RepID=UPI0013D48C29|nr:NADH-quinone oxidoreductase subunit L [Fodinicola acaciae]
MSYLWLLIALPAFGATVLLLVGKRGDKWGHYLGCLTSLAAFGLGLAQFLTLRGMQTKSVEQILFSFIPVGDLKIDAGLLFDPLSGVFVLLITGIGSLIHIYSIGYMAHDEGRRRFFAYLNLFVAAMLLLVLGNGYVMLYVGWEGVGLASYLLIAFWYFKPAAATAAKKAFIMNRVGDVGLTLAIFLMFATLGTTSYSQVFSNADKLNSTILTVMTLLLLLGACGKSGQFPLQAWLPDAMEGPTPVSALIHAATMVTAGVYLIGRSAPLYNLTPTGQTVVCAIGAFTLLLGCIAGCAKDDIKKVLAWSTVSQIGYMFLAVGLGGPAYALGIFHLLCHGFFKAGMFLGAGSVMHGMNDQVDMRRFGGLARYMPITAVTFGLGYLAILGIPPFAGFFSKDAIIEAAFNRPGWTGWLFGGAALVGAGITAFYMSRLFVMTFLGKKRWTEDIKHPHESPAVMWVPMAIIAVGSIGAGFGLQALGLLDWLAPAFGTEAGAHEAERFPAWMVSTATLVIVVLGAALAYWLYLGRKVRETEPATTNGFVLAARNALYADQVNEALFERPGLGLTRAITSLDGRGIDGFVNGLGGFMSGLSNRMKRAQTGFVRTYALTMLIGAVLVVGALLAVRIG